MVPRKIRKTNVYSNRFQRAQKMRQKNGGGRHSSKHALTSKHTLKATRAVILLYFHWHTPQLQKKEGNTRKETEVKGNQTGRIRKQGNQRLIDGGTDWLLRGRGASRVVLGALLFCGDRALKSSCWASGQVGNVFPIPVRRDIA